MRLSRLHPYGIFLSTFAVYLFSMPKTVCLEDDGLFMLATYFNDVSHPPGYPLFTFLGHFFGQIPLGTYAARLHALSAFFGALSIVVLWFILRHLSISVFVAYLACFSLAFSRLFWSQALITEVYTLHCFLFFCLVLAALTFAKRPSRMGVVGGFFMLGLGLSNHWPLLVLSLPGLVVIAWPQKRKVLEQIPFAFLSLCLGLLPYSWMYAVLNGPHDISLYGNIDSFADFLFFLSRAGYHGGDNSPSASFYDKIEFLRFFVTQWALQFTVVGFAIGAYGLGQWKKIGGRVTSGLLLCFLSTSVVLILMLGFDYTELKQAIIRVYFIEAYGVFAIFLALGMDRIAAYFRSGDSTLHVPLLLGLLAAIGITNLEYNFRHTYSIAEDNARLILKNLKANAVLFAKGDALVGTLGYLHFIEKMRPDVELRTESSLLLQNRIFNPRTTSKPEAIHLNETFIESTKRPVYFPADSSISLGNTNYWLFKEYSRGIPRGNTNYGSDLSPLLGFLEHLVKKRPALDPWTKMFEEELMASALPLLIYRVNHSGKTDAREFYLRLIKECSRHLVGKLKLIEVLLASKKLDSPYGTISELFADAELLLNQNYDKVKHVMLEVLRGNYQRLMGNPTKAREFYNRAMLLWPHPQNPAKDALRELNELK